MQHNTVTGISLKYDGEIMLATGRNKKEIKWKNRSIMFSEMIAKFKEPKRTPETQAEYKKMTKEAKDKAKDVGGFVGGSIKEGRRKAENIANRTLITLDLDYAKADVWQDITMLNDYACFMYSTHSHTADKPRFRLVIPLSRPVLPDEYQAVSRMIAQDIGIDMFDDTTYQPHRLMYYPSVSVDAEYIFEFQDGPWLNPDEVLEKYTFGWQDSSFWPQSSRETSNIEKQIKDKQQDPLSKTGLIGAFCRTYTIQDAIEKFLPDVYTKCSDDRFTFNGGSTSAGLVVYEDKFAFSNHATDPISGMLCNAYDLVRIHLFGHEDDDVRTDTKQSNMPSVKRMKELISKDEDTLINVHAERIVDAQDDFKDEIDDNQDNKQDLKEKLKWTAELAVNAENGNNLATIKNAKIILENDAKLKGKFAYNEFSLRNMIKGKLPWDKNTKLRVVEDSDESGLRLYYEDKYKMMRATSVIKDAFALVLKQNKYHPVKDYLESLKWDGVNRIDKFFSEYLGAEDNSYTKACARIFMCGGIARIYNPGCQHDYVITLVGEQGIRKSTFFKILAKNTDWFVELKTIDPKRSVEETMGKWIVEMSELAATKKKEDEEIKAFITNKMVTVRLAYARNPIDVPRQFVLAGTTNEYNYLKDPTGNRRHLPVDCDINKATKSIYKDLESEVDQLWAEAKEIYEKLGNESLYLSDDEEELAAIEQDKHRIVDDEEGSIIEFLNTPLPMDWYDRPIEKRREYFMDELSAKPKETFIRGRICVKELSYELYGNYTVDLRESARLNKIMQGLKDWQKQKTPINVKGYGSQRGFYRK